jgi:hypothetical protein
LTASGKISKERERERRGEEEAIARWSTVNLLLKTFIIVLMI